MVKEAITSVTSFCYSLCIVPVSRSEHFLFNLLEFRFFKDSEQGVALPIGGFRLLSPVITLPYILAAEVIFFRATRYFVKLGNDVVGVVVFRDKPDSLLVTSLGVAKQYRRLGIATFILNYAERVATLLGKEWLKLTVLKTNTPAQRLYAKFGFEWEMTRRQSFILKKKTA